jgi:CBS domain-containing protein
MLAINCKEKRRDRIMKARDIMSKNVITVFPENTVEELAKILTNNSISGVPVIDKDKKVVGIVTEKDLIYRDAELRFPAVVELLGAHIYLAGVKEYNDRLKKILATNVADLMTKKVICVYEDYDIKAVVDLMLKNNINRVPVLDREDKLTGIISRADIVRSIAKMI